MISRRALALVFAAPLLGGCSLLQKIGVTINTDAAKLRAMATAIDNAIVNGANALQSAAPVIAADFQTASNVLIAVNSLTQTAVSLGQLPATKQAVRDLNALATSPAVVNAANGTLPSQPLTLATQLLQTIAAITAVNRKVTATAAVAQVAK